MPAISGLPAASVANNTDQLEVNQGGTSMRVTVEQLLDGVATTEFVEEAIAAIPPTGSLLTGFWTSNTQAFVPPPATGRVRLSVAWPPTVGASIHLYIHNTDADSLVYTWSVGPNVGDLIVLRSITGARLDATVTAKSSSTYLDITVTVLATSGTLANNSRCQIAAIQFVGNYLPLTGGNVTGGITTLSGTAVGAGANTQAFVKASSTANLGIYYGTGDPTFSAAKGSLYSKTDATTTTTRLWVNTNGSTTWTNLTTAA